MDAQDLAAEIRRLRSEELLVLCRSPNGEELVLPVSECKKRDFRYIHIIEDELDELLSNHLGAK